MEDDILIAPDKLQYFVKEANDIICSQKYKFFSFFTSGQGGPSYRYGTQLFYISRAFAKQVVVTCLTKCIQPIDMCLTKNWALDQSTKNYVMHHSKRYVST